MEQPFTWQGFDRMARILQSLGYMVMIFGPLIGLVMLVVGDNIGKLTGIVLIVGSILISLYHISFSLLMSAMHDVIRLLQAQREPLDIKSDK